MSFEDALKKNGFVSLATADKTGRPSVAPKFFLKLEKPYLYIVDASYGRTLKNLRENPKASVSFMDFEELQGFRINGPAILMGSGAEFEKMVEEVTELDVTGGFSTDTLDEELRGA